MHAEPEKVPKETEVVRKRRFWWLLCCSLVVTAYGAYNLTGRNHVLLVAKCVTEAFEASPCEIPTGRLEFVQALALLCEIRIASQFHLRKAVRRVMGLCPRAMYDARDLFGPKSHFPDDLPASIQNAENSFHGSWIRRGNRSGEKGDRQMWGPLIFLVPRAGFVVERKLRHPERDADEQTIVVSFTFVFGQVNFQKALQDALPCLQSP